MQRLMTAAIFAAALASALLSVPVQAQQFQGLESSKPKPTGRTEDGPKNDAVFDKEFRERSGQRTPAVKADPWSDVRPSASAQPTSKVKH
jgi:hypothetical protein